MQINNNYIAKYAVKDAMITPQALYWLSTKDRLGIRIKAPEEAREAIEEYYGRIIKTLFRTIY